MSTNLEKLRFQTSIFPKHFPDCGLVQFSQKNFKYKMILEKTLEKPSLMGFFQMSTNLEKLRFHTSMFPKCFPNWGFVQFSQKNPNSEYFWENLKENPDLCIKFFPVKISQFSRFLLRSEYEIQVKNLKMT